ncbi:MAG: sulfite exporter TauE/SafE family protein [Saprospiraceae bacterium]
MSESINFLSQYHLSFFQWVLVIIASIIIGMSKAGIGSISIVSVSIWAWLFGSRVSTGMVLPMLIIADVLAVYYYKRHAIWSHLFKLIPWIAAGVLLAAWCGHMINDYVFKRLMSLIIIISLAALIWWEKKPEVFHMNRAVANGIQNKLFAATMGLATGFTSMIGNLAGGFSNIYFISTRVMKDNFIGTVAWMFFLLNLFKLPFHVFLWKTVTPTTISLNLTLIPGIVFGFWLGVKIVKNLNEKGFKNLILWLTTISALLVLLDL